jgi:hypothetical protein
VAIAAAITAGLVVVFLRSLPAPPRFDELRIDPGSTSPVTRGIIRRLWSEGGGEPDVASVDDVHLDEWPVDDLGRPAVRLVYRVPIERAETTFVRFRVEGQASAVTLRRGRVVILEAADPLGFDAESESVVVPDGASDLEIEVVPRGSDPRLRITWVDVDDADAGPRSLDDLVESERG